MCVCAVTVEVLEQSVLCESVRQRVVSVCMCVIVSVCVTVSVSVSDGQMNSNECLWIAEANTFGF